MSYQIFTLPSQQALDTAANVLSGATLTFSLTGSSTPTNAYSDSALTTPVANPLSANAAGVWIPIFLDPTITYRVVLKTQAGVVLQTWDPANESLFTRELIGRLLNPQTSAETSAGVTIVNYFWPEGYVDRYGTNTTPGTTDMTTAIQAAINVAHAKTTGGNVYFLPATYRTTSAVVYPLTSVKIHMHGNGATMQCDHNGNGIDWLVTNENYSGHTIAKLTINGPNTFLPAGGYVPPSTGVGINMNRNATTNDVTAYNNVLRDVVVQGFLYGLDMQAVIALNVFGSFFEYNQYGVRVGGGQTNANHFFGTHVRYNRKRGITSDGTTGGSLTNSTAVTWHGCLMESNIPYPFASGGTPPGDSVGIYLNNTYNWIFADCYIENHSASIYLTGASKNNQFLRCLLPPGGSGTRLSQIVLDGAGVDHNTFDVMFNPSSSSEVHVTSNSSSQLRNRFTGDGINFIAGSIIADLDYSDVRPSQNYVPSYGIGLLRFPSQGYYANVDVGSAPGRIDVMGGVGRTLNMNGVGQLRVGNGLTASTTVQTISGVLPRSLFSIKNVQTSFSLFLISDNSLIFLKNKRSVTLNKSGQEIILQCDGDGIISEVGRNFSDQVVGTGTVTGAATTQAVTFSGLGLFDEPNTSYKVSTWVQSITGTPAAGSYTAYATSLATTGFTLNVPTAPGVGNSVTFGFEVIRLDS